MPTGFAASHKIDHFALPAIVAAAFLGIVFGAGVFPSWQVAVEGSQPGLSVFGYPPENSFFLYQSRLWTSLHQAAGFIIWSGFSERTASIFFSGLLGGLCFLAIALLGNALGLRRGFIPLLPLLMLALYSMQGKFVGFVYPVYLAGGSHTYGAIGMGMVILIIALFANSMVRPAAFLAGLAPSIHPLLGAWVIGLVFLFIFSTRTGRSVLGRNFLFPFSTGLGCALVSFIFYRIGAPPAPPQPESAALRQVLLKFYEYWDGHRHPFGLFTESSAFCVAAAGVGFMMLFRCFGERSKETLILLWFFFASLFCSAILSVIHWIPLQLVPTFLQTAMPGRLLNTPLILSIVIIFGMTLKAIQESRSTIVILAAAVGVAASSIQAFILISIPITGLYLLRSRFVFSMSIARYPGMVRVAALCMLLPLAIQFGVQAAGVGKYHWVRMYQNEDDAALSTAAHGKGLLLTCSNLHLIQLLTRRPIVVDGGALDYLPYFPELSSGLDHALRRIYGVELLDPPEDIRGKRLGALSSTSGRALWEDRQSSDWAALADEFKFTEILTYADWKLKLPEKARSGKYILYGVGAETSSVSRD